MSFEACIRYTLFCCCLFLDLQVLAINVAEVLLILTLALDSRQFFSDNFYNMQ